MKHSEARPAAYLATFAEFDKIFKENCPPLLFQDLSNRLQRLRTQERVRVIKDLVQKAGAPGAGPLLITGPH